MPVKLKGKEYNLVSERLVKLREKYPDATIETRVEMGLNHGIVSCCINVGTHSSTGHALFQVGPDKALEKAETTACGRAMAFLDSDLMGNEVASADEISDFNEGRVRKAVEERIRPYGYALQRNLKACAIIQEYLDNGELLAAWEAFQEIDEDDQCALRVASTKGGWLTVEQAKRLKEAQAEDFDPERGVYRSIADKGNVDE